MTYKVIKADPKFHRHIIGAKGQNIRDIKTETGAQINVPSDDSASSEIRVEGTPEAVKAASERLEVLVARLANERNIDLIIPQQWHSHIIGSKGSTISEITAKYPSVSINFPRRNEDSEIVQLRGDKGEVEAVEKEFKKLLKKIEAENFELKVEIYRQFHGEIIGKAGATVRKIRDETNTRINVPPADENKDYIVVIGEEKNCRAAEKMMLKIQSEVANIVTEEVEIPNKMHGYLIGPKGRMMASICEEFGVQLNFKSKSDKITVRGPKESVEKCIASLKDMASAEVLNHHTEEVTVPNKYHRFLIGKGGAALNKLIADTGVTRIFFPQSGKAKEGDDANTVTILGKKDACLAAKAQIEARVKELESVVEETVEVDPKHHKALMSRGRAVRASLRRGVG